MFFRKELQLLMDVPQIDRNGNKMGKFEMADLKNKKIERTRPREKKCFLFAPMNRKAGNLFGKTSFGTSSISLAKAGMVVEAAIALPLFLFGVITMISFMKIYQIQTEHLMKVCEQAKDAGMYAYVLDGSGPEEITIPAVYSYQPIGGLFSLPKVWMYNAVKVRAWTGKEYAAFSDCAEEEQEMVYVTDSGQVYHRKAGCSYLNVSVSQVGGYQIGAMKNKYGESYSACEVCSCNQEPAGSVYITEKGNRYHNLSSCSGLKRTVRMVKESDVSGMRACGRCG